MRQLTLPPILLMSLLLGGCASMPTPSDANEDVLFEDPMTENWEENWFLDGTKGILEHTEDGLVFDSPSSGVTREEKNRDRTKFDQYHNVLWTRQEFEGDIRISYEFTRIRTTWASLLYIQAQGIGTGPYEKDISAWQELRDVSSMDNYFNYMNLLSLSLRKEIRCKRYPWSDVDRNLKHDDVLVEPMADHTGLPDGKSYSLMVEKREKSCRLVITEKDSGNTVIDFTWDLSNPSPERNVPFVTKGRIGLRQMGGNKASYRNFKVTRLP